MSREDHTAIPAADLEQDSGNAPLGAQKVARPNPPVRIHVHSVRKRLADADGISAKAAIDGLIHAGILADDSPDIVRQVTFSQERGEPEQTIIDIEEVR